MQNFTDLDALAKRPLPNAPDGKYPYQVQTKQTSPPAGPTAAFTATHSKLTLFVEKLQSQLKSGPPIKDPAKFVVRLAFAPQHHR